MEEVKEIKETAETEKERALKKRVIIRTYPKISVMLYLVGLISLIFGIIEFILPFESVYRALGLTFIVMYFFLGLAMAYEFTEVKLLLTLAIFAALAITFIILGYLGILPTINLQELYGKLDLAIGSHAYVGLSLASFLILALLWISSRFSYWIIEPSQIIHKISIISRKVEKFSTQNVKITTSITDILAYWAFFKSGTLILDLPTEKKTIVLSLVPNIRNVEKQIRAVLSA